MTSLIYTLTMTKPYTKYFLSVPIVLALAACVTTAPTIKPLEGVITVSAAESKLLKITSSKWYEQPKGFVRYELVYTLPQKCSTVIINGDALSFGVSVGKLTIVRQNILPDAPQLETGIVMLQGGRIASAVAINSVVCY